MGGWSIDDEPPDPRTIRAVENAVAQTRRLNELIAEALADVERFDITTEMLCELNRLAVDGLVADPGKIREVDNTIGGSLHDPPSWQEVPAHLDALCTYLNAGPNRDPVHLAAYALWRLNWIHPFAEDGNGRTARAVSYLILCVSFGRELPGSPNWVEMMLGSREKVRYRDGLAAADRACRHGRADVSDLEQLIAELVWRQLGAPSTS